MPLTDAILRGIQQKIGGLNLISGVDEVGAVIESADGIARIRGLSSALNGELLEFPGKIYGTIFNLEKEEIICAILENHTKVKEGAWVKRTGHVIGISVGRSMLGRVLNPMGDPLDGLGPLAAESVAPLERPAPGVIDREPVRVPLQTGYKVVDALVPIGRGQRELIIGDRQTGKTTLAVDTIISQKDTGVISVYVAVGQKESTVVKLRHQLEKQDALKNTIIVEAPASAPAIEQYLAPFVGCAIAEYFMYEHKKDTLIIYDDLSKHAAAYRHISLLMRRPPGREAYPGDIFYLHSRLLERAAKLSQALGGGSMTALPIIETQGNDISAYIPTNVISITDGQIFLEADLFNSGLRPAVNAGISVSRVGGSAQIKAIRSISGTLRIDLAQYREKEAFSMFSSELDKETLRQLRKGAVMVELLKQDKNNPMPIEEQVVSIFAGVRELLDDLPVERILPFEAALLKHIRAKYRDVLRDIRKTQELPAELAETLKNIIENFKKEFLDVAIVSH
ncbi:MAG: F0F1 ATP synthase subunit alpha [Candidatus Margulisbacteria bacterium]|jgi:F-type H+-transporting ATPase subunit alpha|nr:F0F1 ATP synthase subunit alpha [Candidatus Margulisiibacteriota bacterium]